MCFFDKIKRKCFTNSLEFHMVLKFNISGFREEQAKNSSTDRDDSVNQHGDGVVVDLEEPQQGSEDARHTGTHGG